MAVPVVSLRETAKGTAGSPMTCTKPVTTASGDLLLAVCVVQSSSASLTITPPSGWTLIYSSSIGGTADKIHAAYYKVAGGSEPSSYDWILANGSPIYWAISVGRITGASATNPIAVASVQDNSSSANPTAASITTPTNDCLLLFTAAEPNGRDWTVPSGFTLFSTDRVSGVYDDSYYSATKSFPTAGATGTVSATVNAATVNAAGLIAVAPTGYAPPAASGYSILGFIKPTNILGM